MKQAFKNYRWLRWTLLGAAVAAPVFRFAALAPKTSEAEEMPQATTQPLDGFEIVSIDDELRYAPTTRPSNPRAQHPAPPTPENVDTGKPVHEWQRATDDWFGYRPKLEEKGIAIQPSMELTFGHNFRGGEETSGVDGAYLFNLNVTLDTEKLFGLKGGTFFVNFRTQDGAEESQDGAFQLTSEYATEPVTEITEIWYEQSFLDGKVRAKVGKIDANTEFAHAENAEEFLNASADFTPTILGMPQDVETAFGANVFVYPTEHFYFGVGAYDGAHEAGFNTGANGPATLFGPPGDGFYIGEADLTWDLSGHEGRFAAGYWYHSGHFERFNGGTQTGASGPYLLLDQGLWRENPDDEKDDQGIRGYLQYGYANPAISLAEHHVGGGLVWTGAIPSRDDDQIGLGADWVGFTHAEGADLDRDSELVIESYYKIRALKWLSIKPDLQYVMHPGGSDERDALALALQIVADF
jgi:porin